MMILQPIDTSVDEHCDQGKDHSVFDNMHEFSMFGDVFCSEIGSKSLGGNLSPRS